MSKAIAAVIFLLVTCANCDKSSDFWADYLQDLKERTKNYDDIQPKELSRNYPILKQSNLLVNKGDLLEVKMNKLFSRKTKRHESYYSLPFCRPNNNTVDDSRIAEFENSTYVFKMLEPQVCSVVCRITLDYKTARSLQDKMDDKYNVNMILDGLPLAMQRWDVYQLGYPIGGYFFAGRLEEKEYFINNHLIFTVKYHKDPQTDSMRIVEFLVQPKCIKHKYVGEWNENARLTTCYSDANHINMEQAVFHGEEIIFTYDVFFEEVADLVAHHSSR